METNFGNPSEKATIKLAKSFYTTVTGGDSPSCSIEYTFKVGDQLSEVRLKINAVPADSSDEACFEWRVPQNANGFSVSSLAIRKLTNLSTEYSNDEYTSKIIYSNVLLGEIGIRFLKKPSL
ncbi:MAG: hypothetical protein WCK31_03740 [bacterium]